MLPVSAAQNQNIKKVLFLNKKALALSKIHNNRTIYVLIFFIIFYKMIRVCMHLCIKVRYGMFPVSEACNQLQLMLNVHYHICRTTPLLKFRTMKRSSCDARWLWAYTYSVTQ